VRRALTYVEWIEQNSIKADGRTLEVTFAVNDKKQFSLDALRDALPAKYKKGLQVLDGPK
jgi:hypothetical protein